MAKWEDYVITKLSYNQSGNRIVSAYVYDDYENHIANGELRNRDWLAAQALNGKTFCCASNNGKGWNRLSKVSYENGGFKILNRLPEALIRRRTFISYYHRDDQLYKQEFTKLTSDLIVSVSVENDDIDSDNSDEYIKQLIQRDYLADATVLIVLVGPKTRCRKHVDWEISGALNHKVGGRYAGIMGILLPTHPDFGKASCLPDNLPKRLAKNLESGYAALYDWTTDRVLLQSWIEEAFARRYNDEHIVNRELVQMKYNLCD